MKTLDQRMQAILEAGVAQNKSLDLGMRSYQGVWTAGIQGVRLCQCSSFEAMLEQVEAKLGITDEGEVITPPPPPIPEDFNQLTKRKGYIPTYLRLLRGTVWAVRLFKDGSFMDFQSQQLAEEYLVACPDEKSETERDAEFGARWGRIKRAVALAMGDVSYGFQYDRMCIVLNRIHGQPRIFQGKTNDETFDLIEKFLRISPP